MNIGISNYLNQNNNCVCVDKFGCTGQTPDIVMKRHDTLPPFKYLVLENNAPLDLTDENLVLEVSIWANAKLREDVTPDATYFRLANNIGFEQIIVGDIIVMDRVRRPEYMLVTGFDENNHLVQVQRAYQATEASLWKKGTSLKIFRTMNAAASIESVLGDEIQQDGTVLHNQLLETYLVYNWDPKDTCTPGCYWLEFKLLKMTADDEVSMLSDDTISNISFTPSTLSATDFGCCLGTGVESVRRFPQGCEGFLLYIANSPTKEL